MKGKKILATLVVLAMVISTMVVLNKDINLVEEASATTIGIDQWSWDSSADNEFLNTSLDEIYYGNTLTIEFNGSVIDSFDESGSYYLYYPEYNGGTSQAYGEGSYSLRWKRYVITDYISLHQTGSGDSSRWYANNIYLHTTGPWFVSDVNTGNDSTDWFDKVNISGREVWDETHSDWYDIVGMFWVNASNKYTSISVSPSSVKYDANTSVTLTIAGMDDNEEAWIDIRKDDTADPSNNPYDDDVVYRGLTDGPSYTISGSDMYTMTHLYGAGTYNIYVYRNVMSNYSASFAQKYTYGTKGSGRGFNQSFGKIAAGYGWQSFAVKNSHSSTSDYQGQGENATYNWTTCGPWDYPEYTSWEDISYTEWNLTVLPGDASSLVTVYNATQYWNDTGESGTSNEVRLKIKDYDENDLPASSVTVALYNKTNNPANAGATAINSDYYNTSKDGAYIAITPNMTVNDGESGNQYANKWGWNRSNSELTQTWAPKGKVYVKITYDSVGNETLEWNLTAYFTLTTAQQRFRWVNDGSTVSGSKVDDGVLEKIPLVGNLPMAISFQIQGSDYNYWGDTSAGETVTKAAENITITGDSMFTGSLDKHPNFQTTWFDGTDTWTVPIIPLMNSNGGTITIRAYAYNQTTTGTLTIGGTQHWTNGSIVTVEPSVFEIGAADQTLTFTITDSTGYPVRGATVNMYWIDEDTYATTTGIATGYTIDTIISDENGVYTMGFNTTQQTDNQTAAITDKTAPRNLTVYSSYNGQYGYALVRVNPGHTLQPAVSQNTWLAGYNYDNFWINTTVIGTENETPDTDDEAEFFIKILNEDGDDVTSSVFKSSGYGSRTAPHEYVSHMTNVFIGEPGTYTVYVYNNTHDSQGYNVTFEVEQVDVTCDISEFIWKSDNNISATFSVRLNGEVVEGSLRIDNISQAPSGEYNITWSGTSFSGVNGTDEGDGANTNISIEVLAEDLVNGDITINDITADELPAGVSRKNISFWFRPVGSDGSDHDWARATGMIPVKVPTCRFDAPAPEGKEIKYVAMGTGTQTVNAYVTGRGTPLSGIFVGLSGASITDKNTTTGSAGSDLGRASFTITPGQTGNITVDVGAEGRTVTRPIIIVTSWELECSAPFEVNEGTDSDPVYFTVTVTDKADGTPVEGATVSVTGITDTVSTDASGEAQFESLVGISADRTLTITAEKEGFKDAAAITITVVDIPNLVISVPSKITAGKTFDVVVAKDNGDPVIGATVTVSWNADASYTSGAGGVAKVKAPSKAAKGTYSVTAEFGEYVPKTLSIDVAKAPDQTPGFELLTLIAAIGVAFILLRRRRK